VLLAYPTLVTLRIFVLKFKVMIYKNFLHALLLLFIFPVQALIASPADSSGYLKPIDLYVHGYLNSNVKDLKKALAPDAQISIPRQGMVIKQSRDELITALIETNNNVIQNCTAKVMWVEAGDGLVIAELCFEYKTFYHKAYLVLAQQQSEWRITQVIKMYSNKPALENSLTINH
jgi:hypothetical protein